MDSSPVTQLVILISLISLSAFFSCSETALTTVNKIRIRALIEEGNKRAVTLNHVTENSGKMLSAILIGNNIVNISASALATVLASQAFGNASVGIATGILTIVILIFGEITPKTFATIHAEKIALFVGPIFYSLMFLFTPLIFLVNKLSTGVLLLLHVNPNDKSATITETELRTLVDVSHEEGVLETREHEIISNLFDFGDARAKDVMVPRIHMTMLEVSASYEDLLSTFEEFRFTRIPIYEETTDNVIGIINMKDVLLFPKGKPFSIRSILRESYFTYETKKLFELMLEMRKASVSIVIVLDEYGVTAGLITLEDLLEEIVGDIRDEFDEDEDEEITLLSDGSYQIDGQIKLDEVNDLLDIRLKSADYDSIGGYIIETLDRLPEVQDSIHVYGYTFTVDSLDKNRIEKIHIRKEENAEAETLRKY